MKKICTIEKLLGFSARSRKLLMGAEAVRIGINKGVVKIIVLDPQAGPSTREGIEALGQRRKIPVIYYKGENPLDRVVGKPNCKYVGITDPGFAKSIIQSSGLEVKHP